MRFQADARLPHHLEFGGAKLLKLPSNPVGKIGMLIQPVSQKMNSLRLEADEASAKVEELQTKVKTLEQENLSKEQDITSLQHKNNLLESEVEKLETAIKDFKKAADEGQQHGTQNETLQRRLQLLEEEAEDADKTLREANEKYVPKASRRSNNSITKSSLSNLKFI